MLCVSPNAMLLPTRFPHVDLKYAIVSVEVAVAATAVVDVVVGIDAVLGVEVEEVLDTTVPAGAGASANPEDIDIGFPLLVLSSLRW